MHGGSPGAGGGAHRSLRPCLCACPGRLLSRDASHVTPAGLPYPSSSACPSHLLLVKRDVPVLHVRLSPGSLGREREDALPVLLHADDSPASGLRCVERLVQP